MTAIDLTPQWIEPAEYEEILKSVAADAEALKAYLAD